MRYSLEHMEAEAAKAIEKHRGDGLAPMLAECVEECRRLGARIGELEASAAEDPDEPEEGDGAPEPAGSGGLFGSDATAGGGDADAPPPADPAGPEGLAGLEGAPFQPLTPEAPPPAGDPVDATRPAENEDG